MAIEMDHQRWRGTDRHPVEAGESNLPDWHGLHARLRAARQMGRMLAEGSASRETESIGSFSRHAARTIDAFAHPLDSVNPNDSAKRNAKWPIAAFVADAFAIGDRG